MAYNLPYKHHMQRQNMAKFQKRGKSKKDHTFLFRPIQIRLKSKPVLRKQTIVKFRQNQI